MTVTNTGLPVVSGTDEQGQSLSTTPGTWTFDDDYLSYTYKWLRCDAAGANCVEIPGVTTPSLVLRTADVGSTIRSEVTALEHVAGSRPASYFTGPLGVNNIVPPTGKMFLIAQCGGYGVTWAQTQTLILQREADMGRLFDAVHIHYGGEGTYLGDANCIAPLDDNQEQWIHDTGHFPVVAWTMNRTLADINAGNADDCIANVADYYAALGFRVMIRAFSEFDLPFLLYHGCGSAFISAWQRIVNIFQAQGATNVGWWWNPEEGVDRECVNASYPGDAYVDWIGSDWYNVCDVGNTQCYSTPLHSGWAEWWELFHYNDTDSQYALWGGTKPFVVGETSAFYDPNAGTTKRGNWFRNIPLKAAEMPNLCGISFYDSDVSIVEGPRANFRVDHPLSIPDVYAGWNQMTADAIWNTVPVTT